MTWKSGPLLLAFVLCLFYYLMIFVCLFLSLFVVVFTCFSINFFRLSSFSKETPGIHKRVGFGRQMSMTALGKRCRFVSIRITV